MCGCIRRMLLLAAVQFCSQTFAADLTLQQRLESIAKYKRSINGWRDEASAYSSIYSRTTDQVAHSLYNSFYRDIIHGSESVDIVIVLDGSQAMGEDAFVTARRFLARMISMIPRQKFVDGSVHVAMLTYSLSENLIKEFDFFWDKGMYREMVRRNVKKARYQGGYENHGTSALIWADAMCANSTRYNDTNTKKVILYATNGHITDKDLFQDTDDATYQVAHWLKNTGGYRMFTIVPGTSVDRATISTLSSEPNMNYIIPVVNTHAGERITTSIKAHKRGDHHHSIS